MPTTEADRLGLAALPIHTGRLVLRALRADDAEAIQSLVSDRSVAEPTLRIPHPYPADGAATWIAESNAAIAEGSGLTLAIERTETPGVIGGITLVHGADGTAEVGYWIGRPYWRRGYATEAVNAMLAHGFDRMGLGAVEAAARAENRASIRVLEKAGFAFIRDQRRDAPARGEAVDEAVYRLEHDAWRDAHRLPIVLVAAVALVDRDDRVLIARRPEGKAMAGLWEFPGGKVHDGETPEAALIRELEEELGIVVPQRCLAPLTFASHAYDDFHLLMPLYVCRNWEGIVTAREGQELKWIRPVRLGDYAMPPADEPLIAMVRDLIG